MIAAKRMKSERICDQLPRARTMVGHANSNLRAHLFDLACPVNQNRLEPLHEVLVLGRAIDIAQIFVCVHRTACSAWKAHNNAWKAHNNTYYGAVQNAK